MRSTLRVERVSVEEAARFSTQPFVPGGLAYDAVSQRLLFGDVTGRRLFVVGGGSDRTVDLVRADSAGFDEVTAIAVDDKRGDLWVVELPEPALSFFERCGQMPLPPYIRREPDAADALRYQSIFARKRGAVAAPTASLHFDAPLLAELERRGVHRAFITLHVGAGTFQPVRTDAVGAHVMHAEFVEVDTVACEAIAATRATVVTSSR